MQDAKRNILLDVFKVVAAISLVATHCAFLYEYSKPIHHLTSNGLFRVSLALFFCVTGFYLYTTFKKEKIKFWLIRIGILYIIWMIIYANFWLVPNMNAPQKFMINILFGFNHLWYLAALFVGGFMLYLIRNASNKVLILSSVLLFLLGYTIQILDNLKVFNDYALLDKLFGFPPFHRNFLFFALPFLALGYIIRRSEYYLKISKSISVKALIFSLLVISVEGLINYQLFPNGVFNLSLSFLIFGPVLLITANVFKFSSCINSKILSSLSIAIYLIHPWIIFLVLKTIKLEPTPLTGVVTVLSIFVGLVLVWLNKKVKYLL